MSLACMLCIRTSGCCALSDPLGPKTFWKCSERAMSAEKLAENVTIFTMSCSNSYRFHKPRGYTPTVICNDCYSRQEGVGFKGRSIHQGSRAVSVHGGWIYAKLLVLLLNGATFFTDGEEGSIVTHNGSVPGKHKTKARSLFLLVPFERYFR